jgi:hypothetical protein
MEGDPPRGNLGLTLLRQCLRNRIHFPWKGGDSFALVPHVMSDGVETSNVRH